MNNRLDIDTPPAVSPAIPIYTPNFETATVLIVGGTSGVGLAAALRFAQAGVRKLTIVGRNLDRGQKATTRVTSEFPDTDILFVGADANLASDAKRITESVIGRFGGIDILLNTTVGSAAPALLKNIQLEDIEQTLVQQALAPMLMSCAVLPSMCKRRGGVILNIASDAAKLATPGETVIGGAMAAIVMFSRALALEAKRDGIRVNALTPSLIRGTLTDARMQESAFASKLFEKAAKAAHLGVAVADDLAALAVFLASPAAARITGQAISANGGISAA